jgi:hypothetical protein
VDGATVARLPATPHRRAGVGRAVAGIACLLLAGCGGGSAPEASSPPADQVTAAAPGEATDATGDSTGQGDTTDQGDSTGSGDGTGSGDAGGQHAGGSGQHAPGAPRPENNQAAPGAPIRIPARVVDDGRPLADVLGEMTSGIKEQCGGTLCVTLQVEYSEPGLDRCTFRRTRPPQRSTVPRGSTVVVVAGEDPCPSASDSGGEGTSESPSPSAGESASEGAGFSHSPGRRQGPRPAAPPRGGRPTHRRRPTHLHRPTDRCRPNRRAERIRRHKGAGCRR